MELTVTRRESMFSLRHLFFFLPLLLSRPPSAANNVPLGDLLGPTLRQRLTLCVSWQKSAEHLMLCRVTTGRRAGEVPLSWPKL